jgi:hypothetical protein
MQGGAILSIARRRRTCSMKTPQEILFILRQLCKQTKQYHAPNRITATILGNRCLAPQNRVRFYAKHRAEFANTFVSAVSDPLP